MKRRHSNAIGSYTSAAAETTARRWAPVYLEFVVATSILKGLSGSAARAAAGFRASRTKPAIAATQNLPFRTIGRVLFALPFLIFGLIHFMNAQGMAGIVPSWLPGGIIWIYLTGIIHLLAAIALLIQKYTRLACLLLGLMLLIFVLTVHLPAGLGGDQMAVSQVLKDAALAGGAFVLASLYPATTP